MSVRVIQQQMKHKHGHLHHGHLKHGHLNLHRLDHLITPHRIRYSPILKMKVTLIQGSHTKVIHYKATKVILETLKRHPIELELGHRTINRMVRIKRLLHTRAIHLTQQAIQTVHLLVTLRRVGLDTSLCHPLFGRASSDIRCFN